MQLARSLSALSRTLHASEKSSVERDICFVICKTNVRPAFNWRWGPAIAAERDEVQLADLL
jgi:hypothetical protein